ncbi:hypothetical protein BGX34_001615, partial [Mortierella sp. NVP85]
KSNSKAEHKGKKKDNLGWKIIKLQAQVGETNSRKAKKVVEAEKKKEGVSTTTTTGLDVSEEGIHAGTDLSEAAAKLLALKEQKISQKIYHAKKEIKKTFVKARTFETQRLIKRLKEARKAVEEQDDPMEGTKPASKKRQEYTKEDIAKFEYELELVKTKKAKTTQDDTSKREDNSAMSGSDGDDEDGDNSDVQYDSDSERDDGYDSDGLPLPKTGKSGKASTASSMFIGSLNEDHSQKKNKKEQSRKRDKNDWVDDKFDEIYGKAKKNRPGQRERRMKAERQFGQEANHIKKAAEEARQREEKKAARKAKQERFTARDASAANAQRPLSNRRAGAGQDSARGQTNPPHATTPVDPTLHPSWVAKQTEKAAIAAALTAAKSSKIVFDDSD